MAAFTTNTAFFAALKQFYSDQRVHNLVYANRPLFAMIEKKTDLGGYTKPIPLISGLGGAAGGDFATVQTNQAPLSVQSFMIACSKAYAIATIEGITIAASRGAGARAFLDATRAEIDAKYQTISNYLAQGLYGSGAGSIGQVSGSPVLSTTTNANDTAVFTLDDVSMVTRYERSMVLQFRATEGGTLRADGANAITAVVVAVDRSLGTVKVLQTSTWTAGLGNITSGDFVNVQGNNATSPALAPTSGQVASNIVGLKGWVPDSAPTAGDAFWGVDRSVDPTRLAGWRFDGTSKPIQEALIDALSTMWREGARPDKVFMSPISWAALAKSYEGKTVYVQSSVKVGKSSDGRAIEIGFSGIQVAYAGGVVEVYADPFCPGKRAYVLQMENLALESMGPAPTITKGPDGLEFLRVSNADAFEVRLHAYSQMSCNAPGHCGVVLLRQ